MKAVTALQMRSIDQDTIKNFGLPGEVLMGYAGKAIADFMTQNFSDLKTFAVLCGTGNNGGDGFVIAYFLNNFGYNADVFLAGSYDKLSETSLIFYNLCKNSKINIVSLSSASEFKPREYDMIVDAMLGTGFSGSPYGIIKEIIILINKNDTPVLSVDIPSGLPSDGDAPELAVKADYTLTIGLPKISLVTYPGLDYTGRLKIVDIGFPASLINEHINVDIADAKFVRKKAVSGQFSDMHKGNNGHLLIVGGFDGMEGAAIMAAQAAFETGVGLCTLMTTLSARSIIAGKVPELITASLPSVSESTQESVISYFDTFFSGERMYNVMIIGPGMGRTASAAFIFRHIISNVSKYNIKKVLIDGDGLFHLSAYLQKNTCLPDASFLLTPHLLEASRLADVPLAEINKNRFAFAVNLARSLSCAVLLKGPATISADSEKSIINTTGSPALATAGSGDVLSGITGSLMLKDTDILECAGIGAYIHGLASDIAAAESSCFVQKATDVISHIRKAIFFINQNESFKPEFAKIKQL